MFLNKIQFELSVCFIFRAEESKDKTLSNL